ncbi:MAG: type I glyceraldehyde-3-phosphate dehydrogenase [candidate division Zixibacteria bacterium]|jgi:glyceraldehyde 3-phosphate dehydrogenase|nr:type I glyceraldehyde-3-phosphate dehydrogenase [candidate division Zixibacteria bacterium]
MKVGINGFGRIGRLVFRAAKGTDIEFVGINDITDAKTLAHLLKYDSVHGRFQGKVSCSDKEIIVDGKAIPISAERDPAKLPWKALGADVILECTGLFRSREDAGKHITAGAKKVLISAPAKGHDGTFIPGVNCRGYDKNKHHIISIGSCTTNCLAPVAKVLLDNFGIVKGFMTTIHSYTMDQRTLDAPHKDLRRARAAAVSMIPTTTGAAKAIAEVIPELKGKMDGCAIRVPTPDGSMVDLAVILEKETTAEEINAAMKKAAATEGLARALEYCEDPIVSCDIVGNPHGSILDSGMTAAQGNFAKVFSWYDNEWGFCNRMIDMMKIML